MELELVDNATLNFDIDKIDDDHKPSYDGPDRRSCRRRESHDRRIMIRFELDKADRRQIADRRSTTNVWDKGHTLF